MDKETIISYLKDIGEMMKEGRVIDAYKRLEFVVVDLRFDVQREKARTKQWAVKNKE